MNLLSVLANARLKCVGGQELQLGASVLEKHSKLEVDPFGFERVEPNLRITFIKPNLLWNSPGKDQSQRIMVINI